MENPRENGPFHFDQQNLGVRESFVRLPVGHTTIAVVEAWKNHS